MAKGLAVNLTKHAPGLFYKHGGNPPIAAGLFLRGEDGKVNRIAWWPAGDLPTPDSVDKVYAAWLALPDESPPLDRAVVRKLLKEGS